MANPGNGTVSQVTPGGVVTPFASGFSGPAGLAFAPTAGGGAPEPGTVSLVGMGLVSGMGTLGIARRRKQVTAAFHAGVKEQAA